MHIVIVIEELTDSLELLRIDNLDVVLLTRGFRFLNCFTVPRISPLLVDWGGRRCGRYLSLVFHENDIDKVRDSCRLLLIRHGRAQPWRRDVRYRLEAFLRARID